MVCFHCASEIGDSYSIKVEGRAYHGRCWEIVTRERSIARLTKERDNLLAEVAHLKQVCADASAMIDGLIGK